MIVTVERNHENTPFLGVVTKDFTDYVELYSIKNNKCNPNNIIKVNKEDIREYYAEISGEKIAKINLVIKKHFIIFT